MNLNLNRFITQKNIIVFTWFFLIVWLSIKALTYFGLSFDQDEIEATHTAWKMTQGMTIYTDFFQHHHPFLYYILAPFITFFGESIKTVIIIKWFILVIFFLCGIVTYFFARLFYPTQTAILATTLLITSVSFSNIAHIRPDGLQIFFGLVATYFLFYFFKQRTYFFFILSAICLGISFLFLQKAIFLAFFLGIVLLLAWYQKILTIGDLFISGLTMIATITPYYSYLWYTKNMYAYYIYNWLFNVQHPERFLPFHSLIQCTSDQLLYFGFLLMLLMYKTTREEQYLILIAFGLFLNAVFIVKFSFLQYYAMAFPFIALISAQGLAKLCHDDSKKIALLLMMLLSKPLLSDTYLLARLIKHRFYNKQHEELQFVIDNTSPDDYVYGWTHNLFRHDIDFYWFEVRMHHDSSAITKLYEQLSGNTFDLFASIDHFKPKIVSSYYQNIYKQLKTKPYKQSPISKNLLVRTT